MSHLNLKEKDIYRSYTATYNCTGDVRRRDSIQIDSKWVIIYSSIRIIPTGQFDCPNSILSFTILVEQ